MRAGSDNQENLENGSLFKSVAIGFYLVLALWLVKYIEVTYNLKFLEWGIFPRQSHGLIGILTSPFIHGDLTHLVSNSLPLLISCTMLWYFFPTLAIRVIFIIYILTGLLVWLLARPSYHIGASGVVYGLISFLFFSGIVRWDKRLMGLSMLVVFLYGGLVWGVLPIMPDVSWESHLTGGFVGAVCAYLFRKQGPQRKEYHWEEEDSFDIIEEEEVDFNADDSREAQPPDNSPQPYKINYVCVERSKDSK